jgi:hypothetical protein
MLKEPVTVPKPPDRHFMDQSFAQKQDSRPCKPEPHTPADILEYLPEVAGGKEEDAARWEEKPTAALFVSAPML